MGTAVGGSSNSISHLGNMDSPYEPTISNVSNCRQYLPMALYIAAGSKNQVKNEK
jgi:hypothetical protein